MTELTFYPIFAGTGVSIINLTYIAVTNHDHTQPRTISELAAAEEKLLRHFRAVLLFCGTLFAITMFGFIVPRSPHPIATLLFSTAVITGEILAGIIPATNKTGVLHKLLAIVMFIGMLALPFLFISELSGIYGLAEVVFAVIMTILTILMLIDYKRFVIYELGFIFTSHFSIVVAALALR